MSIDETSFSSYNKKRKQWLIDDQCLDRRMLKDVTHMNISVILALCQNGVISYLVVEGGVNQVFFSEFLIRTIHVMETRYESKKKGAIFVLDNLKSPQDADGESNPRN